MHLVDAADVNQLVAVLEVDCNEAILWSAIVLRHCCLLDPNTLLGSKHQIVVFWEAAGSNNADLLALCQRLDDVDSCATIVVLLQQESSWTLRRYTLQD